MSYGSIPLNTRKDQHWDETRGLLAKGRDEEHPFEDEDFYSKPSVWSSRRIAVTALSLVGLILAGTFARSFLLSPYKPVARGSRQHRLQSNGTHNFKRTVLMISIDGLRADYLDRGFTPHLLDISKKGLRAKYMQPIFPVSTPASLWSGAHLI